MGARRLARIRPVFEKPPARVLNFSMGHLGVDRRESRRPTVGCSWLGEFVREIGAHAFLASESSEVRASTVNELLLNMW